MAVAAKKLSIMQRREFIKASFLTGAALIAVAPAMACGTNPTGKVPLKAGKAPTSPLKPDCELLEHAMVSRSCHSLGGLTHGRHDPTYYKTSLVHTGTGPLCINT